MAMCLNEMDLNAGIAMEWSMAHYHARWDNILSFGSAWNDSRDGRLEASRMENPAPARRSKPLGSNVVMA